MRSNVFHGNNISSPSTPRIESLHHRLKSAKGPDGELLELVDELMVLLEDPPPDARDRWRAGVELCAEHGIVTSRAAVWRFYRAQVVEWRYENLPPPRKVSAKDAAQFQDRARDLLALRAVESLQHPHLSPQVLIGLVHNENRRLELQLARDKFNEQLFLRQRADDELKALARRKVEDAAACRAVWARLGAGASLEEFQQAVDVEKAARAGTPPPAAPKAEI